MPQVQVTHANHRSTYSSFALVFALFVCTNIVLAQEQRHSLKLYFRQGGTKIEAPYKTNAIELKKLDSLISVTQQDSTLAIKQFELRSGASPEGSSVVNKRMVLERLNALAQLVKQKTTLPEKLVDLQSSQIDWSLLRALVAESDMLHQTEVLQIIDYVPERINDKQGRWIDGRRKRLMDLKGGKPYNYLLTHFFPLMRYAEIMLTLYTKEPTPKAQEQQVNRPEEVVEKEFVADTVTVDAIGPLLIKERKPLFAIKTNLLYDAVTALNVEIEVPIGKRWSVSGEWVFPWWQAPKADLTLEFMSGHGAVKYWFGDRAYKEVLTGWSLGAYGGAGKYDLQLFNVNGEQGEFVDFGLQAGFAHKIGKALRLEYAIGVGYVQNDFKKYDKVNDTKYGNIKVFRYPWETKQRQWIGPTSAKISLVWLLNYQTTKKQGGIR